MKPFDFNIHLPCGCSGLDARLQDETSMSGAAFEACFAGYEEEFKEKCIGGNLMLLNSTLSVPEIESISRLARGCWQTSMLTVMVDPRDDGWSKRIDELRDAGVAAIKFHCYIQKITVDDIPACVKIAIKAQSLGMMIMIDTSYGSLGMYQFDNLRLATSIANNVTKTPIVLLHSGGARCLEAMLLADATKNIYLETSFTLPYYLGSSIEQDLAFTYKKLGESKILYGSDFPYVGLEESKKSFLNFMDKWGFTSKQVDRIAVKNGLELCKLHG